MSREAWSAYAAMRSFHLPPFLASPRPRSADPVATLGADHPLVRIEQAVRTTTDQIRTVAGLVLLGVASPVQLGVGAGLLVLVETRRDLCRELIAGGGAAVDLPVVRRERRRLADPRHRARLARSFDHRAGSANCPVAEAPATTPYVDLRLVPPVAGQLRDIAALLRSEAARVRGVALAERLLTFPGSPLCGSDARRLREELARIRFLLVSGKE